MALDILVIYLDGIVLFDCHIVGAIVVDSTGAKHVQGLRAGSSDNADVSTALLNELVEHGVKPDRHRLFVNDGARALRNAMNAVSGPGNPVQHCRIHQLRKIMGHQQLWLLKAHLDALGKEKKLEQKKQVG